jgi:gentisate 1,2-dioxygenase
VSQTPDAAERLRQFRSDIDGLNLAPLWESLHTLVTPEPATPVVPVHWDYASTLRPRLLEAGRLISATQAERRVLVLENPGLRGKASATHSLYAGVQIVLPGEIARGHRHSQSAIRFVLESSGAHTTMNGERVPMAPGDFITTPGWTWHDHGNDTSDPAIWVDVLDVPLVSLLDASFSQAGEVAVQPVTNEAAQGMACPYARSREALATLARTSRPDACKGHEVQYVNPGTGDFALPTIGAFLQLLPAGFASLPYRSTDARIFVAVEGAGETRVGDVVIRWKPRDVFIVPGWARYTHYAEAESVLFSASDRPVQSKLGLWREERG